MMSSNKTLNTCDAGHKYNKSSQCPTCPVCEAKKHKESTWYFLSSPARRALELNGIFHLEEICTHTAEELLQLHGIGKSTITKIQELLQQKGLHLKL
jgi:DNA-directed RNA polymerase alpha subunit